ncbi:hypothetical protein O59_004142 [Cellvibrio sp. BR]|nr:hypothetical protein O59_004142 [Cellvibrio sp. BR]
MLPYASSFDLPALMATVFVMLFSIAHLVVINDFSTSLLWRLYFWQTL